MGKIFKNREKLSYKYIPTRLPHREEQLYLFLKIFEDYLSGDKILFPRTIQLVGVVGSGKTSSSLIGVKKIGEKIRRYGIELKHIYINMRIETPSPFLLYKVLNEKISNKISRSLSAEELLAKFIKSLAKIKYNLFITFDEIDFFIKRGSKGSEIIYNVSRLYEVLNLNNLENNIIGITFISRSNDWASYLNIAEASTLGALIIRFPPYSKEQIIDILNYRISEAIYDGKVDDDVLEYIAEITSIYRNGDIRYALDILLYSGIIAEYEGYDKITIDHARKAIGKTLFYSGDIHDLSFEEKILLLAALRSLKESKSMYVTLNSIRKHYSLLTENFPTKKLDESLFEESIQKLIDLGALELKDLTRITLSPAVNESFLLKSIEDDLKRRKYFQGHVIKE